MTQDQRVRGREFAHGLRECAGTLKARDRRVWFFRAFLEMPSREIAAHRSVALKPSHVDVISGVDDGLRLRRCAAREHEEGTW